MLTRERLIRALSPFRGFVESSVLYNMLEHGVVEALVVDRQHVSCALSKVVASEERSVALRLFLETAGYIRSGYATEGLAEIWEARGWYQMMIGGYGQTFLNIGLGFTDPIPVYRNSHMVGIGSCEISKYDAIPLMRRVLQRRGMTYKNGIDLGCGSGIFLTALANDYPDMTLTGIEASPQGALAARQYISQYDCSRRIHIVSSDAISYIEDHRSEDYDFAIISFVIHELLGQTGEEGVKDFLIALFEAHSSLELLVIDIDYCWEDPARMADPHCMNYYNHYFLLHPFTEQRLASRYYWKDLFVRNGLEVIVEDRDTPGLDETGIVTAMLVRKKDATPSEG